MHVHMYPHMTSSIKRIMGPGLRSRSRSRPESVVLTGVGIGKFSSHPGVAWCDLTLMAKKPSQSNGCQTA